MRPRGTRPRPADFRIGVVGLGLMGSSISACLLAAGHHVVGADMDAAHRRAAKNRIARHLKEMRTEGLVSTEPTRALLRFQTASNVSGLAGCDLAIEAVFEDLEAKRRVIRDLEAVLARSAIIGSNTSALPVTQLQEGALRPQRILGIHWAEPAHITRFMEVICGDSTSPALAKRVIALAAKWGKDPTLVKRDIRGFITNRIMYAMIREAFHLVESGIATPHDVDRSVRNDMGYWLTFAGPFRFMDLTGIPAYAAVMRDLLPDLHCGAEVPELMRRVVDSGARGVSNHKGFYQYTPAEARKWEERFLKFTYEIRRLAVKYPDQS